MVVVDRQEQMSPMTESRKGPLDGMGGHDSGPKGADMIFHFTTVDTTGGGHQGHN